MTRKHFMSFSPAPRGSRGGRPGTILLAIACLVGVLAASGPLASLPAAGTDDGNCSVTQITDTGRLQAGGGSLSLSGDGSRMAFASRANLTGQNPDHFVKVFLYDAGQGSIVQVPPSTTALGSDPDISADGTAIAYSAGAIIHHDISTGVETTVTPEGTDNGAPSISADGSVIVYLRDVRRGFQSPYTVQITDLAMSTTTEIPAGTNFAYNAPEISPDISPDGTKVAYLGNDDPTGGNPDGSLEIFVYDRTTGTTTQATSTLGRDIGGPRFIDDGTRVVFFSDGEFAGPNPSGHSHWFVYDLDTGTTTRMSDLGGEGLISEDGSRISFTDTADVDGANPDESRELFSYDIATAAATQLTALTDPAFDSITRYSQSSDGTTIAFSSNADPTGANPDHSLELFLATTCGPPPRPDAAIATTKTGPFAGDDIYSSVPTATQKQVATIGAGQTRKFFVQIQNDRAVADSFAVQGTVAGSWGYRVRYLAGRTDITSAVRAGTYQVGPLEPGEAVTLKIKITATTARTGSGRRADITARSTTNPVSPDTVRARVART